MLAVGARGWCWRLRASWRGGGRQGWRRWGGGGRDAALDDAAGGAAVLPLSPRSPRAPLAEAQRARRRPAQPLHVDVHADMVYEECFVWQLLN